VGTLTILVVAGLHVALPAFPWQTVCADGYEATSPVGAYFASGYGLTA
jgi:hypothetical protein